MNNLIKKQNIKLAGFLLPLILLNGLSFCFFNSTLALAKTASGPTDSAKTQTVLNSDLIINSCTDHSDYFNWQTSSPIIENNATNVPNTQNSLPSCCLNHDSAAKTETIQGLKNIPESQLLAADNSFLNRYFPIAENFSAYSLGPAPPQEDLLSSIVKKE